MIKTLIKKNSKESLFIFLAIIFIITIYVSAAVFKAYRANHILSFPIYTIIGSVLLGLIIFLITLFHIEKNKKKLLYFQNKLTKMPELVNQFILISIITLGATSCLFFLSNNPTAFVWPGIDMGPYLERQFDATFAVNDFFTNTSSFPNPRHIFGSIIVTITKFLQTDWYSTFFYLRVVILLFTPILFLLVLTTALRKRVLDDARLVFAIVLTTIAIAATFIDRINGIFSIGWWTPNNLMVMPQTVSVLLGLIYIYLSLNKKRSANIILLALSTLIHPSIGIFIYIFFLLLNYDTGIKKVTKFNFLSVLFGLLIPAILLKILFPSVTNLNAKDFVHHYIYENHPFHYLPSILGNFTSFPWYFSFSIICLLFTLAILVGIFVKNHYLTKISLLSLTAYFGSVTIQYFFVELYPIKTIAIISPIRFTIFGYWLLAYIFIYFTATYIPKYFLPFLQDYSFVSKKIFTISTYLILISLLFICIRHKDNPLEVFKLQYPGLNEWVNKNSRSTDVFGVFPNFSPASVPLLLKRGVFFGNGFPFTEDGFLENDARKSLIFGLEDQKNKLFPGVPLLDKSTYFYRSLTPKDFYNIKSSYQLDYIILESSFDKPFSRYTPVFSDKNINVYKVSDFENTQKN